MSKRKYTNAQLIDAVKNSKSYREVVRRLGFKKEASHVNKIINELKLDVSHFDKSTKKGKTKYDNFIGKISGKLKVIEILPPEDYTSWKRNYRVRCECECGNFRIYPARYFKRGLSKSCGCEFKSSTKSKVKKNGNYKGYKEISGGYWGRLLSRSAGKGIEVSVTLKYVWELYEKQNRKCALTGELIKFGPRDLTGATTASLDRIDSSKGYIEGNVQWVHKDINRIKSDFSQEKFIELCNKVVSYAIKI